MNVLITGKNGQLGSELQEVSLESRHTFIFCNSHECDIRDQNVIETIVLKHKINTIINCAAYTNVDNAETDSELLDIINFKAIDVISRWTSDKNKKLIHISTDYVFNGHKKEPYTEDDKTSPINIYGETKLAGELAIISTMPFNSIIIRTGWVYSEFGNNFVKTILNLATKSNTLDIVSDQIGTPTYAYDLAYSILHIVSSEKFLQNEKPTAIFHYSNEGKSSWYEFAKEIISIAGINCHLNPIKTEDYPLPAKRPKYSILSKKKISQEYALSIPHWKNALKDCLKNL